MKKFCGRIFVGLSAKHVLSTHKATSHLRHFTCTGSGEEKTLCLCSLWPGPFSSLTVLLLWHELLLSVVPCGVCPSLSRLFMSYK